MSATNRGVAKEAFEFYPTPPNAVYALLEGFDLRFLSGGIMLEPSVGNGAIIHAIENYAKHRWQAPPPRFDTCDINPNCGYKPTIDRVHITHDFTERILEDLEFDELLCTAYDAIIMNPPFSLTQEFVDACLRRWCCPVFMLQRLNFLGTIKRHEWWQGLMPSWVAVLSDRPFADATEYAWFMWRYPRNIDGTRLSILPPFSWTPTEQLRLELK